MDDKIDRYELKSQLGRGGMATVYHAYDPRFKRYVAVKVLPREFLHDETFISRFEREAMTIANLEHQAIVPVHDFGQYEGQPFLVMRYMPGGSLHDRINRGPMSLAEVCHIIDQLAPALDKAHAQGVIHRDLKPGNILFDEDDNAYLSDFGIAKISEATAQLTGSGIVGTPAYMAPEIADVKELTPAVDIYALGVIVFQMLTGSQPFQAATPMGILLAHINHPIPDIRAFRPDLPGAMQYILARVLAKDPADRYPSAVDLAADLKLVVQGDSEHDLEMLLGETGPSEPLAALPPEPVVAPPEAMTMDGFESELPPEPTRPARRRSLLLLPLIILGVAVIGLLGVGGLVLVGMLSQGRSVTPEVEVAEEEAEVNIPVSMTPILEQPGDTPPPVTFTPEPTRNPVYVLAETGVSSNDDWTPHIEEFDGVQMALVPAGCFMMGSTQEEVDYAFDLCEEALGEGNCNIEWFDGQQPAHQVCFDEPFWIDLYEVTNEQFAAFLNSAGNQTEGGVTWLDSGDEDARIQETDVGWKTLSGFEDHPAVELTWYGANAYCQHFGARLLTEAEWEYVARGPDGLKYPFGDEFDGSLINFCDEKCDREHADNSVNDGYQYTAPVGSYPGGMSWVGALDITGNAWEWVNDWYGENYYAASPNVNPQGPPSGEYRLFRGGSWTTSIGELGTTYRLRNLPDNSGNNRGFRCARSYTPPDAITPDQPTPTATPEPVGDPAINLAFAGVEANSDWTPYIQEFDGVQMALVPAGCFLMGSNVSSSRQPIHEQCFDAPFWIDVYEVTNGQFREFGGKAKSDSYLAGDNIPRDQITWAEALAFCELRGARLPTEVEWEYAARGPDGLEYPWGDEFDCSRGNFDDETAAHDADTIPGGPNCDGVAWTAEVGSFPGGVSWVGAFDMCGNISEWTSTWYAPYPYDLLDGREAENNPGGYEYRVLRGGSWAHHDTYNVSNTTRFSTDPRIPSAFDGVRCARSYGE